MHTYTTDLPLCNTIAGHHTLCSGPHCIRRKEVLKLVFLSNRWLLTNRYSGRVRVEFDQLLSACPTRQKLPRPWCHLLYLPDCPNCKDRVRHGQTMNKCAEQEDTYHDNLAELFFVFALEWCLDALIVDLSRVYFVPCSTADPPCQLFRLQWLTQVAGWWIP